MFLLPGLVVTWYVTETPIPESHAIEIKNYLFAHQHPEDGGWGLHIEGDSSVFGTAMNYVVLRLLGVSEDDPRMIKSRSTLHKLGGATCGPHWAKFWLSVLGVCEWEAVNPVPPDFWYINVTSECSCITVLISIQGSFQIGCQLLPGDGGSICDRCTYQWATYGQNAFHTPRQHSH
jgi:hypothetical protein